jgi:threonine dehydratase
MAKNHVRHMVGGHAPQVCEKGLRELVYRFEFPEKPGALMNFLSQMSSRLEHQPVPLPQPRR